MVLGYRKKFDAGAILEQIAATYLGSKITTTVKGMELNPNIEIATTTTANTLMESTLGLGLHHTPIDAEALAANAIGSTIGNELSARIPNQQAAAEHEVDADIRAPQRATAQPSRHQAHIQHQSAHPATRKRPAAATPAYDAKNDPSTQLAELEAHAQLAPIDLSDRNAYGPALAAYNLSAAQHQNWQVDHSVIGGLDRSWHYIQNRVKSYAHFYDNYIAPSMQGLATAASGPFPYSTSMNLAMNVGLPLATNVMNWPSTMAANYRNFVNMDANDKTFTIITGAYNKLEQVAIGLGSEGLGAVSKIGMFAVAAKTATAAKVVGTGKILGASKLAFGGMFGRTVEVGGNIYFKSKADPLLDILGHASVSHPDEYKAILSNLAKNNVELKFTESTIAFSPNSSGGPLGNTINLPKDFSISALRHEYGHFLDHQALNYPKYIEYFKNPELIIKTERRQYLAEIRLARKIGDNNARRLLIQNYLSEKNYIVDNYYQHPYGYSSKKNMNKGY